ARHDRRAAQPEIPQDDCRQDMEGDRRSGEVRAIPVSAIEGLTLSRLAGEVEIPAHRRNPRYVSRPAAQAARDGGAAEVSGRVHYRDWLAAEGRLSARDARRRLR